MVAEAEQKQAIFGFLHRSWHRPVEIHKVDKHNLIFLIAWRLTRAERAGAPATHGELSKRFHLWKEKLILRQISGIADQATNAKTSAPRNYLALSLTVLDMYALCQAVKDYVHGGRSGESSRHTTSEALLAYNFATDFADYLATEHEIDKRRNDVEIALAAWFAWEDTSW